MSSNKFKYNGDISNSMQKSNPLVSLARKRKKKSRTAKKDLFGVDEAGRGIMTEKRKAIQKAIDRKLREIRTLRKEGEGFEEEDFDMEEEEDSKLDEILEKLDTIEEKLLGASDEVEAVEVEDEDEFPDGDAIKGIKRLIAQETAKAVKAAFKEFMKEEESHKPKVPESRVDTGEDEREVEEEEPKSTASPGGSTAEPERKMVKANYDNEGSKAKELSEKEQLKQKVVFQTTIPSESAEKRSMSKNVVRGKTLEPQGSFSKSSPDGEISSVAAILSGKAKTRDIVMGSEQVFGGGY